VCGTIVWEIKNTRHWQPTWIDKPKADRRAIGANLAVLVSAALPDSLVEFGRIGAACGSPACAPGRRSPWRCEQLIGVAFAHAAAEGKGEKMELLYHYLGGDQFRRRIEATVEAFTARQRGLDGECRDATDLEGARKADRAGARQHRRHVRRGAWQGRVGPVRTPGAVARDR
jgi:hypothetical protein